MAYIYIWVLDDARVSGSWVITTFTNENIMKITMKMSKEILEITLKKRKRNKDYNWTIKNPDVS